MTLDNPQYNWVVRYCSSNNRKVVYNFSEFKSNGNPGYAYKFENIQKFKTSTEALEVARQILQIEGYDAETCRIHIARGDEYYFTGNKL